MHVGNEGYGKTGYLSQHARALAAHLYNKYQNQMNQLILNSGHP